MDILLISETELNDSFPLAQIRLDWFSKRYRLDRCSNGGGILLYIRDDIPHAVFQIQIKLKLFLLRLISGKRNGQSMPPTIAIKVTSHTIWVEDYIANYDNILLLGDFNSEISEPCLNDFCEIYNLKNLAKEPACYENPDNPSCIDLFLGVSDFHKLVVTVLKIFYKK